MKATYTVDITSIRDLKYECDNIKVDLIIDEISSYDLEDKFMKYLEDTYKDEIPTIEELADDIGYFGRYWLEENKPKDDEDIWGDIAYAYRKDRGLDDNDE